MMDAIYTEDELYSKTVAQLVSAAGLIPEEEEISFEQYMQQTSREFN